MTDEAPRLPERAEALLSRLVQAEPSPETDVAARAEQIEQALANVRIGSTESALLEPPRLEPEAGEPAPSSLQALPPRPRDAAPTTLADLARAVALKSPRAETSSLAKQSLSVAAAARAKPPGAARQPVQSPGASPLAPPPRPPTRLVADAAPPARSPASPAPRGALVPFFAGAGVAIAAAAVVALVLRTPAPDAKLTEVDRVAAVAPPSPAPGPQEREPSPTRTPSLAEVTVPEQAPAAAAPPPVSSVARAAGDASGPSRTNRSVAEQPTKPALGAGAAAPPAPRARAQAQKAPAAEKVVLEESEPAPAPHPAESRLRPASGTMATPDRPSPGAVQAALGAVLGAARACVAGSSGASTASIVFSASGGVTKVNVSGPAAGTPAGGCIQSALSRARVAPFVQPTYVVNGVSIRP